MYLAGWFLKSKKTMRKLKNTPWRANDINSWPYWNVYDSQGKLLTDIPEPTARAIAALPETLEKLERLEKAAQAVLDNWESGDGTKRVSELMNNLKKALEE